MQQHEWGLWRFLVLLLLLVLVLARVVVAEGGDGSSSRPGPPRPNPPRRPNFLVVLTDDQDAFALPVETTLPETRRLLAERGTTFSRAFVNTPVCCASRATLLTGRYAHGSGMTLSNHENCGGAKWRQGPEADSLAVKMQQAGYRTLYMGKYLNSYGMSNDFPASLVPPGWTEWFGLVGNSRYWNYTVSDEGISTSFGSNTMGGDYFTDSLARRAVRFIASNPPTTPFLLWISPPAAHAPFSPARRHFGTWARAPLPKSPAFNYSGEGKHDPVGGAKPLPPWADAEISQIFRSRAETLLAVDDLVVACVAALRDRNLENFTYIVFTSDNAFHLGEFRLAFDKRQPYETDIRVPLVVFGPGVEQNALRNTYVSHVDLAPTILDLAGGAAQEHWDGRSFKSVLFSHHDNKNEQDPPLEGGEGRGDLVLVEYKGEGDPITGGSISCGAGHAVFDDLCRARNAEPVHNALCDSWNNTYACVRGPGNALIRHEFLFCQFECFVRGKRGGRLRVPCDRHTVGAHGEYYNLEADPHQLENRVHELNPLERLWLNHKVTALRTCVGTKECQRARTPSVFPPLFSSTVLLQQS